MSPTPRNLPAREPARNVQIHRPSLPQLEAGLVAAIRQTMKERREREAKAKRRKK